MGKWVAANSTRPPHCRSTNAREIKAVIPLSARGDQVLNPGAMRALKAGVVQWVVDVIELCFHTAGAGQKGCGFTLRVLVHLAEREGLGDLGLKGNDRLDDIPKSRTFERTERGPRGEALVWRHRRPGTPAPPPDRCVDVGLSCIRRDSTDDDADEDGFD
ncbi:unnamed protein product [Vitrella brassicaformis CCMP3155]|uniref:Uncharacterized protein n=1 Tax=Vitrella brassicaformis (strain CCMP3155) TaxID=1169540 RepID=A0A0G4GJP0_VITBC|nr:unnamed protein product [Vitrella brassicaformis CCMP3155]|eukprot:CEM30158.1 unnamed protein product [Vitrella brassicaformis CCMP3155]